MKHRGFTVTVVLTLGVGIGATTAIFSVVYAVFEPMPYPKPDQLVMVWSRVRGGRSSVSAGDFLEWGRRSTSFQVWAHGPAPHLMWLRLTDQSRSPLRSGHPGFSR